jgi:dGTP triphosphohydrolase
MHLDAGLAAAIAGDPVERQRAVGDFVAGMTDMFALKTHARVFGGQSTYR